MFEDRIKVNFDHPHYGDELTARLREYGVAILEDVFTDAECDENVAKVVESIGKLSGEITAENWAETWKKGNLPPHTRLGLYQNLVGNFPVTWEVRSDRRIKDMFTRVYSALRGEEVTDFAVAADGLNIKPPMPIYHTKKTKDWAHLDTTKRDGTEECVQSQVVLTNTSACFRCSPKSHLIYEKLLDKGKCSKTDKTNWHMFKKDLYPELQKMVEDEGGEWQREIHAKKGSVILWFSSTVHSAKIQNKPEDPDGVFLRSDYDCPWDEWRCVVYCCYRPREEMNEGTLTQLRTCFQWNRMTNHWGEKVFDKAPWRYEPEKYHKRIQALVKKPEKMYEINGMKPELNPVMRELLRIEEEED